MDDGKVNALSPRILSELNGALDQAAADEAVVVLTGNNRVLSAGFDLAVVTGGGEPAVALLRAGFDLCERLLTFPRPVVIACRGHAIAMGVFVLLSADYRIGADGPFKYLANEVAIGMTMPRSAIEITRQRLTPAAFNRSLILAEAFTPNNAVSAGFLDLVVPAEELMSAAHEAASRFATLHAGAHAATKRRVRHDSLAALRAAMESDHAANLSLL